jgi:hypothetical protein
MNQDMYSDGDEDICYETDIEDLPDNKLSQGIVNDLSELNDEIEESVNVTSDKNNKKSILDKFNFKPCINTCFKDFVIIFICVFVVTNKTVIGNIMNVGVLSAYKKTIMFNVIIGFIIAITVIAIKKLTG